MNLNDGKTVGGIGGAALAWEYAKDFTTDTMFALNLGALPPDVVASTEKILNAGWALALVIGMAYLGHLMTKIGVPVPWEAPAQEPAPTPATPPAA